MESDIMEERIQKERVRDGERESNNNEREVEKG